MQSRRTSERELAGMVVVAVRIEKLILGLTGACSTRRAYAVIAFEPSAYRNRL